MQRKVVNVHFLLILQQKTVRNFCEMLLGVLRLCLQLSQRREASRLAPTGWISSSASSCLILFKKFH